MTHRTDRGLWLADADQARDLATFVDRAMRLDDAAVIRLRLRAPGAVVAWVGTGLDVLASRVVAGEVRPADLSAAGDALAAGLAAVDDAGFVDPGFAVDSAWRGALPPEQGFVHLDDVPARAVLEVAQRGGELAKEHGSAHGPPTSLLDQEVVQVSSGDVRVGIPMRCVFALTAMGFLPQSATGGSQGDLDPGTVAADEMVRVRALPTWLRVDARFGSVYRRRGDPGAGAALDHPRCGVGRQLAAGQRPAAQQHLAGRDRHRVGPGVERTQQPAGRAAEHHRRVRAGQPFDDVTGELVAFAAQPQRGAEEGEHANRLEPNCFSTVSAAHSGGIGSQVSRVGREAERRRVALPRHRDPAAVAAAARLCRSVATPGPAAPRRAARRWPGPSSSPL